MSCLLLLAFIVYVLGLIMILMHDMDHYFSDYGCADPFYEGGLKFTLKGMWLWPKRAFVFLKGKVKEVWEVGEQDD